MSRHDRLVTPRRTAWCDVALSTPTTSGRCGQNTGPREMRSSARHPSPRLEPVGRAAARPPPSCSCCTADRPTARESGERKRLAYRRMLPFARMLAAPRPGRLHAALPRTAAGTPPPGTRCVDARWAHRPQLAERYPGVPVVLVGHSMGGRAALGAAGAPERRRGVRAGPLARRLRPGRPARRAHRPDRPRRPRALDRSRPRRTPTPLRAKAARGRGLPVRPAGRGPLHAHPRRRLAHAGAAVRARRHRYRTPRPRDCERPGTARPAGPHAPSSGAEMESAR